MGRTGDRSEDDWERRGEGGRMDVRVKGRRGREEGRGEEWERRKGMIDQKKEEYSIR